MLFFDPSVPRAPPTAAAASPLPSSVCPPGGFQLKGVTICTAVEAAAMIDSEVGLRCNEEVEVLDLEPNEESVAMEAVRPGPEG